MQYLLQFTLKSGAQVEAWVSDYHRLSNGTVRWKIDGTPAKNRLVDVDPSEVAMVVILKEKNGAAV